MVNITPTVDLLELIVVVMALVGLAVTTPMVLLILAEQRALHRRKQDGIFRRTNNSDLREETSRAWRLLGFLIIGVLSALLAPPVRSDNRWVGDVAKVIFMSYLAWDVWNAVAGYLDRRLNMEEARRVLDAAALAAAAAASAAEIPVAPDIGGNDAGTV